MERRDFGRERGGQLEDRFHRAELGGRLVGESLSYGSLEIMDLYLDAPGLFYVGPAVERDAGYRAVVGMLGIMGVPCM